MQTVDTAVILAAGMGTRLTDVIEDKPKGLLKIGDREIIKESLDRILKGGIKNIIMVTGYQKKKYTQSLNGKYPDIKYVYNPDYATTGNMHSLFLARELIETDFLLLESDLLYEDRCITTLLETGKQDAILLSGETNSGDEVYVYGKSDLIKLITKKKETSPPLQGELVGISKISLSLYEKMCDYYHLEIPFPSDFHYEDCLSSLSGEYDICYHKVKDIIWTEIDDPSHYERAVNYIYPRIYGTKP